MDNDIDAAKTPTRGFRDSCTPFLGGQVGLDEQLFRQAFWARPRCCQHLRSEFLKQAHGRSASPLGSGRYKGAFAPQVEKVGHQ